MEPISMDREYTTRDGREVSLLTTDGKGALYPVIGEYCDNGQWYLGNWTKEGEWSVSAGSPLDLIPKPRKHTLDGWLNIYETPNPMVIHPSREVADICAGGNGRRRIACLHIIQEYTEGEGLSPPPGEGAKE